MVDANLTGFQLPSDCFCDKTTPAPLSEASHSNLTFNFGRNGQISESSLIAFLTYQKLIDVLISTKIFYSFSSDHIEEKQWKFLLNLL